MKISVHTRGPRSRFFGAELYAANSRDPLGFMERLVREHGDLVGFKIGSQKVFLLNHPDYIKDVLLTHYANFLKGRGINRRKNFLGEGLLTSEGDFHRRQRHSTLPAFHRERLDAYGETMTRFAENHSSAWRAGEEVDVLDMMRRITLPISNQTLFGTNTTAEHDEIIAAFQSGIQHFQSFRPLPSRLATRLSPFRLRQLKQSRRKLETLISRIIEERRHQEEDRGDLLSMLLARDGEDDARLQNDEQIRDEAVTIFIGGFENVATALTWTWHLLAFHPEAEKKLHDELDTVIGARLPVAADLPRLAYTRMVLEEAMRILPPVPRLVRTAIRDYRIEDFVIPAGSLVVVSQYLMHRDARYFPEPGRFDPERWTPDAKKARPAYCYFPFGGGARRCIGEGFAYMEGVLVLATLASRWRLRPASHRPVELRATHFLHPKHPLKMFIEKRKVESAAV